METPKFTITPLENGLSEAKDELGHKLAVLGIDSSVEMPSLSEEETHDFETEEEDA